MPVMAGLEASSLWGQWRLAYNLSIADPRAQAVTPEQALLDLEIMAHVRQASEPQSNEAWFAEQEANFARQEAEEAALRALENTPGIPSVTEGNNDPEAALKRLMAMVGRGDAGPGPTEVVSLEA